MTVKTAPFRISPEQTIRISRRQSRLRIHPGIRIVIVGALLGWTLLVGLSSGDWSSFMLAMLVPLSFLAVEISIRRQAYGKLREHNEKSRVTLFDETGFEIHLEGQRFGRSTYADFSSVEVDDEFTILRALPSQHMLFPTTAFLTDEDLSLVLDRFRAAGVKIIDRRKRKP